MDFCKRKIEFYLLFNGSVTFLPKLRNINSDPYPSVFPFSQDPVVLLLTLVMYLHPHFSLLHFGIIVQSVFNLAFVRGAISVATKLSKEERGAWQRVRKNGYHHRTISEEWYLHRFLQRGRIGVYPTPSPPFRKRFRGYGLISFSFPRNLRPYPRRTNAASRPSRS